MPLTSDQYAAFSAALNRLATFYDGDHAYNPATYPGALRQGGSVVNFVPALKDVATVMSCASILVADATAASGASPKALRVDGAQSFLPAERGTGRANLKLPVSTYIYSSGNRSLTKDDVGSLFYVDSTQTITIPLLSDCVVGDNIEFYVYAGTLTLAQPAGNANPIGQPGSSAATIALSTGAYVLRRHDTAWRLHNSPNNAVQRSGDVMSGTLITSANVQFNGPSGGSGSGIRYYTPNVGDYLIRLISNNRLQICDNAATVEYFSFGADGTISTRQFGDLNSRIESRGAAYRDAAYNSCVSSGRWIYAGDKGCDSQPGTGGFISPFGGHCMSCDFWTWRFQTADGQQGSAPFAYRYRYLQLYCPNGGGWVTTGAAS